MIVIMKLYNSKSRRKELFAPLSNRTVKMYVCGITPYDTTHLGHAFTYICFDTLRRYLEFKDYKVIYTQNVTDIDDDILKRAKKENRHWIEIGEFWTKRFLGDMKSLNIISPNFYVKATDSIPMMIHIIEELIKKGFAYEKEGNVYFEVKKFKDYGRLSHYSKKQMILLSKERGAHPDDPLKKHPLDFVLWQKSLPDEPFWNSPWGQGRPGWHIECSAMIYETFGKQTISGEQSRTIDIHGGGRDLIFPHHESEIAQSESFTDKKPFVNYWIHTAMVLYEGEKMSKSLGNLVMVSDLLKTHTPNEIRYVLLSHHYREPWEFEYPELHKAKKSLELIHQALNFPSSNITIKQYNNFSQKQTDHYRSDKVQKISNTYFNQFIKAMDNDLQTQEALKIAQHLAKRIIHEANKVNVSNLQQTLLEILNILGFKLS